ncbi:hypothetical protein SDJN03_06490, partial [Cucurbita argyrosperma subsp. sororia]
MEIFKKQHLEESEEHSCIVDTKSKTSPNHFSSSSSSSSSSSTSPYFHPSIFLFLLQSCFHSPSDSVRRPEVGCGELNSYPEG